MSAKHVQIAESEGAQAGFDAYMRVPASKNYPAYAEITKKRTPETQLAAYCKTFGIVNDSNGVIQERTTDDVQSIVEAAVRAALGINTPEVVATPAKTKAPRKTAIVGITNDQAWKALGADPAFKSANRGSEPATNGQLYRLNVAGMLTIS